MSDQSGEPQSSGEPLSPSEPRSDVDVDVLRLKRHAILSTALPFPKLDWRNQKNDAENLKEIRDYSESLANSTLDWYLAHHKSKKRKAKTLHFVIFLFVGLAAIPPLLKVGFANGLQSACEYCDWLNNHTGVLGCASSRPRCRSAGNSANSNSTGTSSSWRGATDRSAAR
jgi:hypothetical protein